MLFCRCVILLASTFILILLQAAARALHDEKENQFDGSKLYVEIVTYSF